MTIGNKYIPKIMLKSVANKIPRMHFIRTMAPCWVCFPISLFVLHALWFGSTWIIDDAGISFAYARNLASGFGLVSQPGMPQVEGYSNPLWVFVLSTFFMFNAFELFWTPKIVSILIVAIAFIITHKSLARYAPCWGGKAAIMSLSMLSIQPAFVIWCVSGLENPLTIFLVSALTALSINFDHERRPIFQSAIIGFVCAALSLNRPDGIVFTVFFLLFLLFDLSADKKLKFSHLATHLGCSIIPLLMYFIFRWVYFGSLLPNTYYAKGGVSLEQIISILTLGPNFLLKTERLFGGIAGRYIGGWLLLLTFFLLFLVFFRKRNNHILTSFAVGLLLSMAIYVLLPYDWMPEYRFATPFFFCIYIFLSCVYFDAIESPHHNRNFKRACKSGAVFVCLCAIYSSVVRSYDFKNHMPIPITEVLDTSQRFERYSHQLQIQNPSIMIADIGGFLFRNKIRVYDLGMLCDKEISSSLGEGIQQVNIKRFHNYVFDEIKPTFIATRAYHSWIANLDSDPQFRENYVPIFEYRDKWILSRYNAVRFSGDYVLKQVIINKDQVFSSIQQDAVTVFYPGL